MPLYEYECDSCGRRFEVRQSFGQDGASLKCPACGAGAPRRLFSSFSCAGGSSDSGFSSGSSSGCSSCSSGNCSSCGH